jgi:hypothetical protein
MSDRDAAYEEDYRGFQIRIEYDETFGEGCRDWDNAGTLICWHSRYNLGDKNPYSSPEDFFEAMAREAVGDDSKYDRMMEKLDESYPVLSHMVYGDEAWKAHDKAASEWKQKKDNKIRDLAEKNALILPVYLYDHSGLAISTGGFSDPWDSGQVGYIFIRHSDILKEWGGKGKRLTQKVMKQAEKYLDGEVETYNDELQGRVYGYIVEKDGDDIDSCWGFYPDHPEKYEPDYTYCLKEARSIVDWHVEKDPEAYQSVSVGEVANGVPA